LATLLFQDEQMAIAERKRAKKSVIVIPKISHCSVEVLAAVAVDI
jgi:hypothetical protein